MTVAWLISVVIVETTAAVMLAFVAVSLLRQLRQKTHSNQTLIAHQRTLEAELAFARQKEAEALASVSAFGQWHRAVINHSSDIIFVHGLTEEHEPGPLLEVNDTACALLGYDRETLLSKTVTDLLDVEVPVTTEFPTDVQVEGHRRKLAQRVVRNIIEKAFQGTVVRQDESLWTHAGQKLPVEMVAFCADFGGDSRMVWIARDVSAIRAGECAVRESRRRMEDFFSHSPLGIAMFDTDRRLLTVNRACLRMFGMPDAREFERFNIFDNPFLPPDARRALHRGESIRCEIVVDFVDVRKTGTFSSHRRDKGHFDILISNLGVDAEYRPRGYFAQIEDITQRRRIEAELRRLQMTGPSAEGISGTLEDVALTDIVQLFAAGGRSIVLTLTQRDLQAQLYMREGAIIHCVLGAKTGEEAFYEVVRWKQGKFTAKPCTEFPPRTITAPVMTLLMEGARRMDEVAHESVPSDQPVTPGKRSHREWP